MICVFYMYYYVCIIFFCPIPVHFTDCTDRGRFRFHSTDGRIAVYTDGVITVSIQHLFTCSHSSHHKEAIIVLRLYLRRIEMNLQQQISDKCWVLKHNPQFSLLTLETFFKIPPLFYSMSAFSDDRFSLQVRRPITIYEPLNFNIETWSSQGRKMTLPVRILYHGSHHRNHHGHHQHRVTGEDPAVNLEVKVALQETCRWTENCSKL